MLESFILPLSNGEIARARPIRRADKLALNDAFQRLSDESKYGRFLTITNKLNDRQLTYFTEVDQVDHVAWGVETMGRLGGQGIAIGRYIRLPQETAVAEFALTVTDAYQGNGLGTFLLALLYHLAQRDDNIQILRGVIGMENNKMLSWMNQLGADVYRTEEHLMHADLSVAHKTPQLPQNHAADRFRRALDTIQQEGTRYKLLWPTQSLKKLRRS
ncbi:MAG: N-acetyltransferase [Chloroflexota bacterium]